MTAYDADKLPPWPILRDGWEAVPMVRRRLGAAVGTIVFVKTEDRIYVRDAKGTTGSPLARYTFAARKIATDTRVSFCLESYPGERPEYMTKVPKRDLSSIYGADDVEDALWIGGGNAYKIAQAVQGCRNVASLMLISEILRLNISPPEYRDDKERA
jgi:hypothetical protein